MEYKCWNKMMVKLSLYKTKKANKYIVPYVVQYKITL